MKTKYAIFYSSCNIKQFRNGSIIADFTLGFTRYQNVTRLNGFLTRTIVNKQLFGGTILSIVFDLSDNSSTNDTDYDTDYNSKSSVSLWDTKHILDSVDYVSDAQNIDE